VGHPREQSILEDGANSKKSQIEPMKWPEWKPGDGLASRKAEVLAAIFPVFAIQVL